MAKLGNVDKRGNAKSFQHGCWIYNSSSGCRKEKSYEFFAKHSIDARHIGNVVKDPANKVIYPDLDRFNL